MQTKLDLLPAEIVSPWLSKPSAEELTKIGRYNNRFSGTPSATCSPVANLISQRRRKDPRHLVKERYLTALNKKKMLIESVTSSLLRLPAPSSFVFHRRRLARPILMRALISIAPDRRSHRTQRS
jgi:hypothetical protein